VSYGEVGLKSLYRSESFTYQRYFSYFHGIFRGEIVTFHGFSRLTIGNNQKGNFICTMTTETFKLQIVKLQPKLQAFAMRILQDEFLAEDITQEVFAFLWQNVHKLDLIDNLEAYSISICKCRCIDNLRKRQKCVSESVVSMSSYYVEAEDNEDLCKKMLELLERLPARQRDILKKKYLEAKHTKEIVEEMNMSEANVRTNISRAYARLREMMNNINL